MLDTEDGDAPGPSQYPCRKYDASLEDVKTEVLKATLDKRAINEALCLIDCPVQPTFSGN
jgi:hypothetical protein